MIVLNIAVVKIGDLAQADFISKGDRPVAVKQVGMIIIHELLDFIIPLLLPARVL